MMILVENIPYSRTFELRSARARVESIQVGCVRRVEDRDVSQRDRGAAWSRSDFCSFDARDFPEIYGLDRDGGRTAVERLAGKGRRSGASAENALGGRCAAGTLYGARWHRPRPQRQWRSEEH